MTCNDIKKKLKSFLEDLLSEKEYQAFAAHLRGCSHCKQYVGSIGSLSNQLQQLGDVRVPSDFSSTVIFKLTQDEQKTRARRSAASKKLAVRVLVAVLAGLTLFFGVHYLKTNIRPQETYEPSSPLAPPERGQSEEVSTKDRDYVSVTFEYEKESVPIVSPPKKNQIAVPESPSLHWHLQYTEDDHRAKLVHMLTALGIRAKYQSYDLVLFAAKGREIEHLLEKIILTFQGAGSLRDCTAGVLVSPNENCDVSIYLEHKRVPVPHWHISFTLPHQKLKLLDMIKNERWSVDYESEDLIVFFLPGIYIKKLKVRIQAMRVRLSEFGRRDGEEDLLGATRVSIYFPE